MNQVTDKEQVKELLESFVFNMKNKMNNHEGELTTLDEKDITDIVIDARLGGMGPKVETDGEKVVVTYPFNVCTLESTLKKGEAYEFNFKHEGKFVATITKIENRGFVVEQEDGTVTEILRPEREVLSVEDVYGNKLF
jgi:hypothetical protein